MIILVISFFQRLARESLENLFKCLVIASQSVSGISSLLIKRQPNVLADVCLQSGSRANSTNEFCEKTIDEMSLLKRNEFIRERRTPLTSKRENKK